MYLRPVGNPAGLFLLFKLLYYDKILQIIIMKGEAVAKDCEMAMEIKKVFMSALLLGTLMLSGICYAEIKESDLNIGGIYCGMPFEEVLKRFGEPVRAGNFGGMRRKHYIFNHDGAEFAVTLMMYDANGKPVYDYDGKGNPVVAFVGISDHHVFYLKGPGSRMLTAAGIGIGATYDEVIKAYGKPDRDFFNYGGGLVEYYTVIDRDQETRRYLAFGFGEDKRVKDINFDGCAFWN